MRDTLLLRTRLQTVLAGLPLVITGFGLGACDSQQAPPATAPAPAAAPVTPPPATTPPAAPEPPPYVSPYPARTGMDPYDPDGLEEEGCPNGDWCGPAAAASKLAVPDLEAEIGCPPRLIGSGQTKLSDRVYKGLSQNPMMQGRLRKIATAELRESSGDANVCCYHWFDYCSGRPLLSDDLTSVRAPQRPGSGWLVSANTATSAAAIAALTPADREAIAALWRDDAGYEHASVASFARATLELLAVGAPPALVAQSQQASLDEIRHAQACFGLAALYGPACEPGPLPALAPRGGGLVGLACTTLLEGCIGETIAALAAVRARRTCEVAVVADTLAAIADDETRHAELAWATLAYAINTGGPEVAAAVRTLGHELLAQVNDADIADLPTGDAVHTEPSPAPTILARHGRLSATALAETRRDAWREVIGPMLDDLLPGFLAAAPRLLA